MYHSSPATNMKQKLDSKKNFEQKKGRAPPTIIHIHRSFGGGYQRLGQIEYNVFTGSFSNISKTKIN